MSQGKTENYVLTFVGILAGSVLFSLCGIIDGTKISTINQYIVGTLPFELAVGKLAGGFGAVVFIPLLVKGNIAYVFSLFPMFWVGKFAFEFQNVWYVLAAFLLYVIWIGGLYRLFARRINI